MNNESGIVVRGRKNAFKCRVSTYALQNNVHDNLISFLRDASVLFISETKKLLDKFSVLKMNACLEAKMKRGIHDESVDIEYTTMYMQTKNKIIDCSTDLSKSYIDNIEVKIIEQFSEMCEQGSGWTLHEIVALVINNNRHQVFNGAAYINLPDFVARKKAVINVQNTDNECFRWAVLAALHPNVKTPHRVSSYYPFRNELNFDNIEFPVTLNQLKFFEKNNETISINVYAIDEEYNNDIRQNEKVIVPIRITENVRENHIHLLSISDVSSVEDKNSLNESEVYSAANDGISLCEIANNTDIVSHYCYIKNLAKLVGSQCNAWTPNLAL